jgi:hypothetical protein
MDCMDGYKRHAKVFLPDPHIQATDGVIQSPGRLQQMQCDAIMLTQTHFDLRTLLSAVYFFVFAAFSIQFVPPPASAMSLPLPLCH